MAKNKNGDKADKKNTSFRIDKDKLKKLKMIALEKETSIQKILEDLIQGYLEENGGKSLAKPKT